MRLSTALLALLVVSLCAPAFADAEHQTSPLAGTWSMKEITVVTQRGENSYPDPAPGLFIFGEDYYSMVWMPLTEAPEDFAEVWRPTEGEMATAFGSIIVNSGTYTYTDSTVVTLPLVAKTPEFIGGTATYTYSIIGDTLRMEMTDALSHGGVRDPGIGVISIPLKLVRVE